MCECDMCVIGWGPGHVTLQLRPSLPYQDMTREKLLGVKLLLFIIVTG